MSKALDITWEFENTNVTSDSVYSITEVSGDHMIQNGGDSPVPSVKSFLTIEMPTTSQTGNYTCLGGGMATTIHLEVGKCLRLMQIMQRTG